MAVGIKECISVCFHSFMKFVIIKIIVSFLIFSPSCFYVVWLRNRIGLDLGRKLSVKLVRP